MVSLKEREDGYKHAELLAPFIEEIKNQHPGDFSKLQAVAVSGGPGSYTGLRIGVSLAKGLCYALQLPLIEISTLQAMTYGAIRHYKEEALYCPMLDARRMEVYNAIYNHHLENIEGVQAAVVEENIFENYLERNSMYFFGNGAGKLQEVIRHPRAIFVGYNFISARYMGTLAREKFQNKEFADLAYYEPFYLKSFEAIKSKNPLQNLS
jgi:tRNA threonylcarbamoyladenosine biosynthesis protein TsaB